MKSMSRVIAFGFVAGVSVAMCGCGNQAQTRSQPDVPKVDLSTGKDTYGRVLGISVSDIGGTYRFGSQIPITVRITNCTPAKAEHPRAQLFPHLTVWVKLNQTLTTDKIKLPIENRIGINPGETFVQSVDLSLVSLFSAPGKYDVSIGHENGDIEDIGDWTGTLRSRTQSIEIKNK